LSCKTLSFSTSCRFIPAHNEPISGEVGLLLRREQPGNNGRAIALDDDSGRRRKKTKHLAKAQSRKEKPLCFLCGFAPLRDAFLSLLTARFHHTPRRSWICHKV